MSDRKFMRTPDGPFCKENTFSEFFYADDLDTKEGQAEATKDLTQRYEFYRNIYEWGPIQTWISYPKKDGTAGYAAMGMAAWRADMLDDPILARGAGDRR